MTVQNTTFPSDRPAWKRLHLGRAAAVGLATLLLGAIGGLIAPQSLSVTSLVTMVPFAAILAVATLGQHLVIQQRGLDMSVAGVISLTCVLVTALPARDAGALQIAAAVAFALLVGGCVGLLNGVAVVILKVPSLVATIGVNAMAIGSAVYISNGVPSAAPDGLAALALGRTLGIPHPLVVAVAAVVLAAAVLHRTVIGRRFLAVGINPVAARSVGIPVLAYGCATYAVAGLLFALAGLMLAAFVAVPTIMAGNEYMLATVAAVIVGGNSLAGGRNSLAATLFGVVFLTYLGQFVLSVGLDSAMQDVVKAGIIVIGIALPVFVTRPRGA